jgi:hypothetical protein
MFYKKEEVDSALTCSVCSRIFHDPRNLPCGETACHGCIQSSSDANNEFKCHFCEEKHKPDSEKGFPPSQACLKMMKAKASEVSRNKGVEKLRSKLEEVKQKNDLFKASLDNGTDQVEEYCNKLKNQVQLQTDILIEQVQQYNEELVAQIDRYKKQRIECFKIKIEKRQDEFGEFIIEINEFCDETLKYLDEFIIEDTKIEDALALANTYIRKLKKENYTLKYMKFDGKLTEFKHTDSKHDSSLLGSFVSKQLNFDFESKTEIQLDNQIIQNYRSSFHLFKLENETNAAFYITTSNQVNMFTFDNSGRVNSQIPNLFNVQTTQMKMVKLSDTYLMHVSFSTNCASCFFKNQTIPLIFPDGTYCHYLSVVLDEQFNYIRHERFKVLFTHMASNSSNMICAESSHKFSCYALNLNLIESQQLSKVQANVTNTTLDLEMNEKHLFVLCNTKKLKIFDLKTFDLAKEIDTTANQMKLLSTDYLALFDSNSCTIYFYDQDLLFGLGENVNFLGDTIDSLTLARDKTQTYSFFSQAQMKFYDFN